MFAKEGKRLAYVTTGVDSTTQAGVYVVNFENNETKNVFAAEKAKYKNLAFSESGMHFGFIADLDSTKVLVRPNELYFYADGSDTAIKLVDQDSAPEGYRVSSDGKISFAKDDSKMYFGLATPPILQDTTFNLSNGQQTVQLDFDVPIGSNLQLGTSVISKVDLSGIRKQLKDAKVKIKDLTAQIDTLIIERDSAIVAREAAVNEREALAVENTDLKDRIQRGALPQFGALITSSYSKKKKLVSKSKKVKEFLITFDIENNPLVTEIVEEEVTIRLIDPDGGVLSKNNKRLRDKSQVFTLKESITFDGAHQKVKWKFPPRGRGSLDGKLKKGKYTTELWTRGLLRQKNTFTLK